MIIRPSASTRKATTPASKKPISGNVTVKGKATQVNKQVNTNQTKTKTQVTQGKNNAIVKKNGSAATKKAAAPIKKAATGQKVAIQVSQREYTGVMNIQTQVTGNKLDKNKNGLSKKELQNGGEYIGKTTNKNYHKTHTPVSPSDRTLSEKQEQAFEKAQTKSGISGVPGPYYRSNEEAARRGGRSVNQAIKAFDKNNNGVITQGEVRNKVNQNRTDRFARADKNNDGTFSRGEMRQFYTTGWGKQYTDKKELNQAVTKHINALDRLTAAKGIDQKTFVNRDITLRIDSGDHYKYRNPLQKF
jgi:hypothetical protein